MFKAELGQLGKEQVRQQVTSWRHGSDRGNVTHMNAAEEGEDEEPTVVTEWVWVVLRGRARRKRLPGLQTRSLGEGRGCLFVDEDVEGRQTRSDDGLCFPCSPEAKPQQRHTCMHRGGYFCCHLMQQNEQNDLHEVTRLKAVKPTPDSKA